MASSVGSLVVRLGLDAGEFTQGLTKAEYQAQQFASKTRSALLEVGKVIAGLEIGRQLFENTKEIISQAASLNDLSDATGSTVENLSRLANQAKIAGTDFATMQAAVLKLSAGMAGADDESTKVKEALKILGVTAKDPVEALQQVAIKLNTYADGVNKVGLAVALFGKQGPAFLATLKDIAELQDVGATVSAKQAAEAENLEKAFRRLGVEATTFRNIVLNDVVPALTSMITEIVESTKVAGGLLNAFRLFSGLDLSSPTTKIRELEESIAALEKQKTPEGLFSRINNALVQQHIDDAKKQIELLRVVQQRRESALGGAGDPGGLSARGKPPAPNPPSAARDAKALKERTSDAERYIQTLEKQLQGTLELNAEETILVELYKLQKDAQSGLTASSEALIRDYASQVQAADDLKKKTEELRKEREEEARAADQLRKVIDHQIEGYKREATQIADSNQAIEDHIAFLKGGESALRALEDARLASTIAQKESVLADLQAVNASQEEIDAINGVIDVLKQRQVLLKQFDLAKQLAEEKKVLEDFANSVSDSFSNAFEGFIKGTKSAKDAFRSFVDDIESMLIKLALKKLMNQILGVDEKGPDIFSLFGKLLGSFGGAGAGGAGIGYGSAGSAIPIGPYPYASGTDWHPGGLAMVGENGPEIVNLPRGSQVWPHGSGPDMGGVSVGDMHFHIQGQVNSASIRQIRNAARDGLMQAARDR